MDDRTGCRHTHLTVIKENGMRLRCRYCHLTLEVQELTHGYCPECYASSGKKRDEFEEVSAPEQAETRYRCEDCGEMLSPSKSNIQ